LKYGAGVHDIGIVPRLAWIATILVYLVLSVIPGRLRPWEKLFNDWLFVAVVVFVGTRVFARYIFHGGLIFRFALIFAGAAAAIGIPLRIKALIARIAANRGDRSR
jgi:hypothetical protein